MLLLFLLFLFVFIKPLDLEADFFFFRLVLRAGKSVFQAGPGLRRESAFVVGQGQRQVHVGDAGMVPGGQFEDADGHFVPLHQLVPVADKIEPFPGRNIRVVEAPAEVLIMALDSGGVAALDFPPVDDENRVAQDGQVLDRIVRIGDQIGIQTRFERAFGGRDEQALRRQ